MRYRIAPRDFQHTSRQSISPVIPVEFPLAENLDVKQPQSAPADKYRMKILHVIFSLDPADGGPPVVAARLAAAQASLGHEVHLISYTAPIAKDRIEQSLARVPHTKLLKMHFLPPADRKERLFATNARQSLNELIPQMNWVHIHGVWEMLLKTAANIAKKNSVGYCFVPSGMLDPWSLAQKSLKKQIALAFGFRSALSDASFIHVLNDDEGTAVRQLHLKAPIEVLANGIFIEEIDPLPAPGSFFAAHPELAGRPYILFLSRLHYKKGLDYLADAFAIIATRRPDVQLVVAGPDGGAEKPFIQQIEAAGLRSRTHMVGPIYGVDKFAALVDSALFCLPTRQEGFSVAVIEAMASGIPVVISPACHFPEVATVGAGEIVPLEPAAIAAAFEKILSDPEAKTRMGHAGSDLIRREYVWPAIAARSVEAYQRALAKKLNI
jgi:glycosyltransferase involved in cell wall biosynthesis